ncbi:MAG: cupin domain-containing protein [Deltaproteobacteria bacterium]|nr:cupin domain-containing protein [Deltaproteobacteria bacterium]
MNVTNLKHLEKLEMTLEGAKNVAKQVPISKDHGSPNFSLRVFTISPNGHTPFHSHPFEHLNYIIEGEGVIVSESGEERPVGKGDFALILPDEKHRYKNTSPTNAFVMICAVPKEYE